MRQNTIAIPQMAMEEIVIWLVMLYMRCLMSEFSSEKSQIPVFYFGSDLISTSRMDAVQFASKFGVFWSLFWPCSLNYCICLFLNEDVGPHPLVMNINENDCQCWRVKSLSRISELLSVNSTVFILTFFHVSSSQFVFSLNFLSAYIFYISMSPVSIHH